MPDPKKDIWTLQDAKNRFSEVVRDAIKNGPQMITRHGVPVVFMVESSEFERMRGTRQSVYDYFRNSPLYGAELDLARSRDEAREIELPDFDLPG